MTRLFDDWLLRHARSLKEGARVNDGSFSRFTPGKPVTQVHHSGRVLYLTLPDILRAVPSVADI